MNFKERSRHKPSRGGLDTSSADCAMVLGNTVILPPKVAGLVREMNTWGPKTEPGTIVDILTGKWSQISEGIFTAEILKPHLPDYDFFTTSREPWRPIVSWGYEIIIDATSDDVDLEWVSQVAESTLVFVHQGFFESNDPLKIELNDKTLVIDWEPSKVSREWMMDLCAGGFGGWHYGQKFLEGMGFPQQKVLAVEIKLETAVQYVLNHEAALILPTSKIPRDMVNRLQISVVFHSAVEEEEWTHQAGRIRPAIAVVSAPCPSWSASGMQ